MDVSEAKWHAYNFGDANRLENGNTLVTAANKATAETYPHRIFEVTAEREVVWELLFDCEEPGGHEGCAAYRATRIPRLTQSL